MFRRDCIQSLDVEKKCWALLQSSFRRPHECEGFDHWPLPMDRCEACLSETAWSLRRKTTIL